MFPSVLVECPSHFSYTCWSSICSIPYLISHSYSVLPEESHKGSRKIHLHRILLTPICFKSSISHRRKSAIIIIVLIKCSLLQQLFVITPHIYNCICQYSLFMKLRGGRESLYKVIPLTGHYRLVNVLHGSYQRINDKELYTPKLIFLQELNVVLRKE